MEEEVKVSDYNLTGNWVITYPSGERLKISKENNKYEELSPVPICLATDPDSQQVNINMYFLIDNFSM